MKPRVRFFIGCAVRRAQREHVAIAKFDQPQSAVIALSPVYAHLNSIDLRPASKGCAHTCRKAERFNPLERPHVRVSIG